MTRYRRLSMTTIALAALAAGCAKAPPAPPPGPVLTIAAPPEAAPERKTSMTLTAAVDTNPDASGRPSPVVVRVYQLKTDASFSGADFFALFDDDQKVLGAELITRDEFMLSPSESRTIDVALSNETRFVGAMAAFRDFRNSQWRGLVPTPRQGLTVAVERARVVVSARAE